MNPKQVERFFKGLSRDYRRKAVVYLTGAAAGALMGNIRPSLDVDFGVETGGGVGAWAELEAAVEKNRRLTGLAANYGEDIDRWGQITLLDYKKHATRYKTFGKMEIRVLSPGYWSIGKMTRYLEPDIRDMEEVFKKAKVPAPALARLWGRVMAASLKSTAQFQFARQVEHFLKTRGPRVWGKAFDPDRAIRAFRESARVAGRRGRKGP